jgi:hypothetical protein
MMFLIPAYWILFGCVIADLQSIPIGHRTWRKALAGFAGLVLTPLAATALIWPEMVDRFPLLADAPGATIAVLLLSAIPMEGVSSEKG